jgi:hypothetical protein
MLVGMKFGRFFMMMNRMKMVTVSYVRMVSSLFMIPLFMMLSSFMMMLGSKFQMFCGLLMMFYSFGHDRLSPYAVAVPIRIGIAG